MRNADQILRHLEDMPTLEIVTMPAPALEDMKVVRDENRPIYQQWGFWILLAVCIVVSFASGVLIRTGGNLFG